MAVPKAQRVVFSLRQAKDLSTGETLVAASVVLRNDVPDDLPNVEVDLHRLSQIFYNIIGNACKFTSKGFVKVTAALVGENDGSGSGDAWVRVSVEDSGNGIAEEDIPRLFKEFGQANNAKSRQFAGTGLGLCICKQLVELHGGKIWVSSTSVLSPANRHSQPSSHLHSCG